MGRRKKNKLEKKYKLELNGLILVLISIIGFGSFGIVGNLMKILTSLLVGNWYNVLLVALFVVGIYMMIKRERPKFLNTKLLGLYIFSIGLLVLSQMNYLKDNNIASSKIFDDILEQFTNSFKTNIFIDGGGIIGGLFTWGFNYLFDTKGTNIIVITLMIFGIVMATGISLFDLINKIREKGKKVIAFKNSKKIADIKPVENAYETDKKIVSSYDELTHPAEPKQAALENTDYLQNKDYHFPPIELLLKPQKDKSNENQAHMKEDINLLIQVLKDFGIESKVVGVNIGPSVTQYELEIKAAIKLSKILSLNREIALALAAKAVRIEAPIPGKKTVGIEIPNKVISMVTVREILETIPSSFNDSKLLVTLGKSIMGKPVYLEINKTPHLLVAGATGSGKSVCINSFIISILMRTRPDEVKLLLVDPKKVELSVYNGVPHLIAPVVTDPRKASIALKKIISEMDRRYDLFEKSGTKSIDGYNALIEKNNNNSENKQPKIPYIVVIIDELADLMLVAAKEVEDSIMRITQMARAAGIHLIAATQRPSTDVITGIIKANIPSRLAFAVATQVDSRTILDSGGADKLLGKGDMLFAPMGENIPMRVQGTYISEEEIKRVVDHTIKEQIARYDETLLMDDEEMHATTMMDDENDANEEPLYNEIVKFVVDQGKASASLLQRRFRLGYNRAARVMDLLEERGIVGPNNGSKPREVLVEVEAKDED